MTKAAHSNSKKDDSETAHENDSTETYSIDESGHVFGNFPSYYRFNLVSERLRFLNQDTIQALRNYLFRIPEQDAGRPAFLLDVGCNEGNLTIALYRRLVGIDEFSDSGHEREAKSFDISCVSRLNDLSQRQKININFRFKTEEVESGQKWYQCSVYRNDQLLAGGSGISKRVAKALAAESALSVLTCVAQNTPPPPIKKSLAEEEKSRRHLFVLGVDIDSKLIKKATMKTVDAIGGDVICFKTGDLVDTVASNRLLQTFCRENCNGQTDGQARFTLVTCFSVLMWIHINHGDDGLEQFLQYLSDSTDHLLVELQKWKCYRHAEKRLKRLRQVVPGSFYKIQLKHNIAEAIEHHLLAPKGQFRYRKTFGVTQWDRPVILFSKFRIPAIEYDD
ncbi:hypothetical protein ABG067_000418 [Albugo candida]